MSDPETPRDPTHCALVLSPHPDDAVLGCWSALDRSLPAAVINVFAGIPPEGTAGGWDSECGVPDSAEMMRRRRREDEAALAVAGVAPVHLDFLDRQYTAEPRDVEAIASRIEELMPQPRVVYAPAVTGGLSGLVGLPGVMLDPHPDHATAREVALRLRRPETTVYMYAEIPYASGNRGSERWPDALRKFTPLLEATVGEPLEFLISEHSAQSLARRLAAVRRYETQMPRLEEGVGPFSTSDVLRYEVCWKLRSLRTA